MIDFANIRRFNFTYAMTGGAWLEDSNGHRDWVSSDRIDRKLGDGWFLRQVRKQGMFTGCWIEVA